MANNYILRIGNDGNPVSLYTYDAQNQACTIATIDQWSDGTLTQLNLVILVPATWVYHSQTHVASKNMELLAKSIPFAIEEELSNEVEDNYFAFQLNGDGSQSVVAIEKHHLDQLHQAAQKYNLNIESIRSEVDWLPAKPHVISVWRDAETSLIRLGDDQTMRVANHQINQLLPVFANDMKQIVCNEATNLDATDLPITDGLSASQCCTHLMRNDGINLYVDELKINPQAADNRQWTVVIALGMLLLFSWATIQGIQWYSLQQSIDDLKQQQTTMLQNKFSDAAPAELMNPFAALQSRLQLQTSQSGSGASVLLDAVEFLGLTARQQKFVSLAGLRLVEQKLEIQITAPNMTVINDFHQALQQRAYAYNVQIGVNELSDDNTFKSILTMVPR